MEEMGGEPQELLRRWKIPEKAAGLLKKGRFACGSGWRPSLGGVDLGVGSG